MPRTKQFDPDAALDSAMRLFWKRGFEATSVQELVDATGLSRSSLYSTFGDKQQLYLAALDRYRRHAGGRLMADLHRASARAGIECYLWRVVEETQDEKGDSGCFMTNATVERGPIDHETGDQVRQSRNGMVAAFTQAVQRAQAEGDVAAEKDAQALGAFLASTVYGLRTLARTRPPHQTLDRVVASALAVLD